MKKYKNKLSDYPFAVSGIEAIKYEHDMLVAQVENLLSLDAINMLTSEMRNELEDAKVKLTRMEEGIDRFEGRAAK